MNTINESLKDTLEQIFGKVTNKFTFSPALTTCDPVVRPVIIIGQLQHLDMLKFSDVSCKLVPRVTEETFRNAISRLHSNLRDECSVHLDIATIAKLPAKVSRSNTNSRANSITKLLTSNRQDVNEQHVVIVCERENMLASGCAVVRAFPLFSRKTAVKKNGNDSRSDIATNQARVVIEFVIIGEDRKVCQEPLSEDDVNRLQDLAYGISLAQRIIDTPCNEMNVDHFTECVKEVGKEFGIVPKIIRGEELRERGFNGIYGVGRAAEVPPALVVLSHEPKGAQETIALVGKGIVYDTGGLSIKGKTGMPGMKRDCAGAAAVLGAFYAAVKAGFTQNLHGVFCLAENSVGPKSTRPDDIHLLYSGRTVEINNTDAEGRIVLAEGVSYANKDLKANIILNIGSVTGAQRLSVGNNHSALLTNSEIWEAKSIKAGKNSGDLLGPLLYCPEFQVPQFESQVADMKNTTGAVKSGESACAGIFIADHLGFDYPGIWIHLDIAGPSFSNDRATGVGVALMVTLFGNYTKSPILKSVAP